MPSPRDIQVRGAECVVLRVEKRLFVVGSAAKQGHDTASHTASTVTATWPGRHRLRPGKVGADMAIRLATRMMATTTQPSLPMPAHILEGITSSPTAAFDDAAVDAAEPTAGAGAAVKNQHYLESALLGRCSLGPERLLNAVAHAHHPSCVPTSMSALVVGRQCSMPLDCSSNVRASHVTGVGHSRHGGVEAAGEGLAVTPRVPVAVVVAVLRHPAREGRQRLKHHGHDGGHSRCPA